MMGGENLEKRSFFKKVFGKQPTKVDTNNSYTQLKMMDGYTPYFTSFSGELYDSDVIRACIDAIARNAAKLKAKHIRRIGNNIENTNSNIERLLSVKPNPYMSAYDFIYKIITILYLRNNAFVFIDWDDIGVLRGLYPIDAASVELLELRNDPSQEIYAKFRFRNGQTKVLPYSDLIHLRRHFYKNDIFGESNDIALTPTVELINTSNDGIVNAVKASAYLRGLLKFSANLKPDDLKKQKDAFVADYMTVSNNGGVAAVGVGTEFLKLELDPKMVDDKQLQLINQKAYNYFGISEAIVRSNYTEDEWNAFYSSVIEPLSIQLSLAFTTKLFTEREKGFGNEIIYSANRLSYASNQTKVTMAKELLPLGLFSINEMREVFELEPVKGGDKRIQTLNVVDASKANQYQGVDNDGGGDNNNNEQTTNTT